MAQIFPEISLFSVISVNDWVDSQHLRDRNWKYIIAKPFRDSKWNEIPRLWKIINNRHLVKSKARSWCSDDGSSGLLFFCQWQNLSNISAAAIPSLTVCLAPNILSVGIIFITDMFIGLPMDRSLYIRDTYNRVFDKIKFTLWFSTEHSSMLYWIKWSKYPLKPIIRNVIVWRNCSWAERWFLKAPLRPDQVSVKGWREAVKKKYLRHKRRRKQKKDNRA